MRSKNNICGEEIIKRVDCSYELGKVVEANLGGYIKSLEKIRIYSPMTKATYIGEEGVLMFRQQLVKDDGHKFPHEQLIQSLKNYKWQYGIDSNPNNFFFNSGRIINVDFFPFLIKNNLLLKEQFDYPVETVLKRYFSAPNSIVSYIIRLFKEKPEEARRVATNNANYLIKNYPKILPRERLRLYFAFYLLNNNKIDQFTKVYINSKATSTIDEAVSRKLYEALKTFLKS